MVNLVGCRKRQEVQRDMNLLSSSSMFGTVWEASSSFPLPCALKDKYIIDKASTRLGLILVNGLAPIED